MQKKKISKIDTLIANGILIDKEQENSVADQRGDGDYPADHDSGNAVLVRITDKDVIMWEMERTEENLEKIRQVFDPDADCVLTTAIGSYTAPRKVFTESWNRAFSSSVRTGSFASSA